MQISKLILLLSSVLSLSLVSASAFIMPKSIALKSMSNNNINHLTIRKGFNNNQNKSRIIKFKFEINDINDNFLISSIIMCIYFYVNYWLINLFFNFYIRIISNQ